MKSKIRIIAGCLLLIALLRINAKAQTYYPMAADSATWTVVEYGYGTFPPETGVSHFGLSGDTLINNLSYHKIYYNPGGLGFVNPDTAFNLPTAMLFGVFREDASKKVWYRQFPADTSDVLLYDYALNVGDTFCFHNQPCGVLCHAVSLVDSILVNGSYRRQIHFNFGNQEEAWIEGLGSKFSNWVNQWCFVGNLAWFMNCYKENGNPVFGSCDFPTGLKENGLIDPEIIVYPNPAIEQLKIESAKIGASLFIENTCGQVLRSEILSSLHSTISLESLPPGLYLLQYRDTWKKKTFKLIIQD